VTSFQTTEPVRELAMNITGRAWGDLIHQVQRGDISYDLPYQRGPVWKPEQRMMLIYSIGKPRKPTTPKSAAWVVAVCAMWIVVLVIAAHKLGGPF
jgi:hypothetical protein